MKTSQKDHWGSITLSLDELSLFERAFVIISLFGVLVLSFPHFALAASHNPPLVSEVNLVYLRIYLAQEKNPSQDQVLGIALDQDNLEVVKSEEIVLVEDPRPALLQEYLLSKNSPMAEHVEALLVQKHYVYVVAIAFAESNFCKKNIRPYNCWGIGGGNPLAYRNYAEAFAYASGLVEKYRDAGMTSPELMRNTWVGWQNDNWIVAVNMVIGEMQALGL